MRSRDGLLGLILAHGLLIALPACGNDESESQGAGSASRVLIVGGGESHDFATWFDAADAATLSEAGAQVTYTDAPSDILPALSDVDALYLSNNQALPDPELRDAIFELVDAGNGLVIGHAAAWYNWEDWPEYNRDLVGGGANGHRAYGDFEVRVTAPEHPVMQGVPSSFTIEDELYYVAPDTAGAEMTVLATAREPETGAVYPIVWTVDHGDGRIVVNTLGHDGAAHQHPAYRRILQNSLRWTGRSVP